MAFCIYDGAGCSLLSEPMVYGARQFQSYAGLLTLFSPSRTALVPVCVCRCSGSLRSATRRKLFALSIYPFVLMWLCGFKRCLEELALLTGIPALDMARAVHGACEEIVILPNYCEPAVYPHFSGMPTRLTLTSSGTVASLASAAGLEQ